MPTATFQIKGFKSETASLVKRFKSLNQKELNVGKLICIKKDKDGFAMAISPLAERFLSDFEELTR